MAGKDSSSSASQKPYSSSFQKKSRWEPSKNIPSDRKQSPSSAPASAAPSATIVPSSKPPLAPLHPPSGDSSSFPLPDAGPPPSASYGFHMLERRTIVLADGSVRSYFALPPDSHGDDKFLPYGRPGHGIEPGGGRGLGFDRHYPPPGLGRVSPDPLLREREREEFYGRQGLLHDSWPPRSENPLKRKYAEEDELVRQRQKLLQYGSPDPNGFQSKDRQGSPSRWGAAEACSRGMDDMRPLKNSRGAVDVYGDMAPPRSNAAGEDVDASRVEHSDVDQTGLKKVFLLYVKSLNENGSLKKNYLENGKNGALRCLACDRDSKDYTDAHGLIMHAYNALNSRVEHIAFHKALCVLMGWNYMRAPDNLKTYQSLPEDEAAANGDDLIMWPPVVIIHNTNTGRRKDGRMGGMGNKEMDNKLRDLGFGGGKSKSVYGKDGHTGITVVRFANSQSGLEEAEHLVQYFEKDDCGRKGWARVETSQSSDDDDENPHLVQVDAKTGEKKRILYGYLGTASDLDKVDFDTKKRSLIQSRRELDVTC